MTAILKKWVTAADTLSSALAELSKYLIPALIFVLSFEVTARYVFNRPTVWVLESSKMLFGATILAWGYTLKKQGHVRVDVFYTHFSRRIKAFVDVILCIIFLLPIEIILIISSFKWVLFSLKTGEKMVESSWLPPAAPFRMVILLGLIFFCIQTLAELAKNIYFLMYRRELVETETLIREVLV